MAAARQCDICGKYFNHLTDVETINKRIPDPNYVSLQYKWPNGSYMNISKLDCCPTCMQSIQDHIKGLKSACQTEILVKEDL